MEQSEKEIEQLERRGGLGSSKELMRVSFLLAVDVAVDMVCRLLAGCTLEESCELTRPFWRRQFDDVQALDADLEIWQTISGSQAQA